MQRQPDDAWRTEWEKLRQIGKTRFIWSYGVLRWGGFMFFFSLAVFQYAHFGHPFSLEGNWIARLLIALPTWIFVGYGYGRSQWQRNEARFAERPRPLRTD
jgi:hypothetical protein